MKVGHNLSSVPAGLVHARVDFLVRELLTVRHRAFCGHSPTDHDLDPVNTLLQLLAHRLAHVLDPVGLATEEVGVAAGPDDRMTARQHSRALDEACFDRALHGNVDEISLPDVPH